MKRALLIAGGTVGGLGAVLATVLGGVLLGESGARLGQELGSAIAQRYVLSYSRAQEYEAKINSGDPVQIAEVVRDLFRNAGQPDQSFSERQIYELALDRLAAEAAAIDRCDKATAIEKLMVVLRSGAAGSREAAPKETSPPAAAAEAQ